MKFQKIRITLEKKLILTMTFLVGNWKMHGNWDQIRSFAKNLVVPMSSVQPVLCLPFPYLDRARALFPASYALAGQDCASIPFGVLTGQVSALMLRDVGCQYVIVGHTECAGTNQEVQKKALCALDAGLVPIICFAHLEDLAKRIPMSKKDACLVAYEPTIGCTTLPPHLKDISHTLRQEFPAVLYGGGVQSETLPLLVGLFDGFLVGRASLDVHQWNALVYILQSEASLKSESLLSGSA